MKLPKELFTKEKTQEHDNEFPHAEKHTHTHARTPLKHTQAHTYTHCEHWQTLFDLEIEIFLCETHTVRLP